jgi:probable HAF family extracellular repeat protein
MPNNKSSRSTLVIVVILLTALTVVSLTVTGTRARSRQEKEIAKFVSQHETVSLDTRDVARRVRESGRLSLTTATEHFELQLTLNDMRAPNYRAEEVGADGVVRQVEMGTVRTFKGKVLGIEESEARFTIDEKSFEGVINIAGEIYYVEALSHFDASANSTEFIIYKGSHVVANSSGTCGVALTERLNQTIDHVSESVEAQQTLPSASSQTASAANLQIIDLATEADNEYLTALGSSVSANNEIMSIMNQVDGIYQANFGITFQIVYQHTWVNTSDPYSATGSQAMLDEFVNFWNSPGNSVSGVARDLTHMWTGRTMEGTRIGIAKAGVLCKHPSLSYGISTRLTNANTKYALTAHEFGHNLGASPNFHPDQLTPPVTACANTIMNSASGASTFLYFCQFSRDEINAYLQTNSGCLSLGPPAKPIDFSMDAKPSSGKTGKVAPGINTSYAVSISPSGAFIGLVDLSVSGLPGGAEAIFNPFSVYLSGSGSIVSSEMRVLTSTTTPPGTYTLTITGRSGSLQHSATATLVVGNASFETLAVPSNSTIRGINNAGKVLGGYSNGSRYLVFIYDTKTNTKTDLPTLTEYIYNIPLAFNDSDEVIGGVARLLPGGAMSGYTYYLYSGGTYKLFQNTQAVCRPTYINKPGQVAGDCGADGSSASHYIFLHSAGVTTLIPVGTENDTMYTTVTGFNDAGQIVGTWRSKSNVTKAFLYNAGQVIDLGARINDTQSFPRGAGRTGAITNSGKILIGSFIYDINSNTKTSLNMTQTEAINSSGQVVGTCPTGFCMQSGSVLKIFEPVLGAAGPALGINESGMVVSTVNRSANPALAITVEEDQAVAVPTPVPTPVTLYPYVIHNNVLFNINDFIPIGDGILEKIWTVAGFNESGQIVGTTNTSRIFISSFVAQATVQSSLQLSASNFSVSEVGGVATITVTRTGDTTGAATINYTTSDTAGLASCNPSQSGQTGKASERCDYSTSLGTLRWAAGDSSSKTFTIPLVNDLHAEGNETFNVTLFNPSGASLGTISTAVLTIEDDDQSNPTQNPIDTPSFFINEQYLDFLGRLPDAGGFANWMATLGGCPGGGYGTQNSDCDRIKIAMSTFQSAEFQSRGYWAYRFYEVAFGRRPSYNEFIPDMALVGGSKSPTEESLSKDQYMADFILRSEFTQKYNSTLNNPTAYVDLLLQTAGLATHPLRSQLISQLQAGQKTSAQVLREIVESKEVEDRFYVRGFVSMMYYGFLRRDPDPTGFQNYVDQLNQTWDPRKVTFDFIYSPEYMGRFGKP